MLGLSPLDFTRGVAKDPQDLVREKRLECHADGLQTESQETQTESKYGTFRHYKTIQETSERSDSAESPGMSSFKKLVLAGEPNPARNLDSQFSLEPRIVSCDEPESVLTLNESYLINPFQFSTLNENEEEIPTIKIEEIYNL